MVSSLVNDFLRNDFRRSVYVQRARDLVPVLKQRAKAQWQHPTHHTVNGCALRPGDLLGTGTLSGPEPAEAAALLELSQGGKRPVHLPDGETRTFLEDGDTVTLRGWAHRAGLPRIGFGNCTGRVAAA